MGKVLLGGVCQCWCTLRTIISPESHPAFDLTGLDPVFRLRADLLGSCVPHVYLHGDILLHSWSLRDFTDVVVAGGDGGPDGRGPHEQDTGLAVHPLGGHDLRVPLRSR